MPGVDLRARILNGAPSGSFGTAFTVGLSAGLATRVGRDLSRVPSLLSLVLPEAGLLARSYASPRAYLAWSAPLAYQAHSWAFLSLELTPTFLVVPSSGSTEYVALISVSGLRSMRPLCLFVVLSVLFAAESPAEAQKVVWGDYPHWVSEVAAGGLVGADFAGGETLAGVALRGGVRWRTAIGDDRHPEYTILQTAFGNAWGVDLRLNAFGATHGLTTLAAGVAFVATHALVTNGWGARVRLPSVLGIAVPEVGVATHPGRDPALYASWSAAFAFLTSRTVALEVEPRAFIIYGVHTETDRPRVLFARRSTRRGKVAQLSDSRRRDTQKTLAPVPAPRSIRLHLAVGRRVAASVYCRAGNRSVVQRF